MTFGLCNAPATFQTFMNNIFEDLIDTGQVVIYLDDILIFTHVELQLDKLTHQVLGHLECYDLFLKPEKCFFDHMSIEYLGIIIMEGQNQWHYELAYPEDIKECTGLSRFLQFLPPLYQRFFSHRTPHVRIDL